ncbi:MAG: rRNA (guanosine2251-2-O)-methyltransferase [Solirubrobacteraceae bacterium]|jgi:23S rRNA (guanosine2251-2'-O)-methyltransferase|nr:rRNA (guanosine2251-2-O)-methyltransferase [Solirubrobacteraceae bacterium]
MIVYGRQPVRELLAARRRPVERIWATRGVAAEFPGAEVADADAIAARAGSDAHQGVCALTVGYPYVGAHELLAGDEPFLVALDEVQDPQNLGAIARTAEVAGAGGLVIPQRRSAEVTPAACKASAGAVEHLRIARVGNLADFLGAAKQAGLWCYGADAGGRAYAEVDYAGGVVLVLGAEGKGLRPRVAKACDELISLPVRGRIASLNVSAAAAALMYGILQEKSRP